MLGNSLEIWMLKVGEVFHPTLTKDHDASPHTVVLDDSYLEFPVSKLVFSRKCYLFFRPYGAIYVGMFVTLLKPEYIEFTPHALTISSYLYSDPRHQVRTLGS